MVPIETPFYGGVKVSTGNCRTDKRVRIGSFRLKGSYRITFDRPVALAA